jgi:hypothetical protein
LPCQADELIVPAYFYPGTGGPRGVGDGWTALASAATKVPVTAILNRASGPGTTADPNYVAAIKNLENSGGKVVGYVFTNFGMRPAAEVEADIKSYITLYGSSIDGFFLDQMNVVPGTLSYYKSLDNYIKGLSASDLVIGNPGQPFLNGVSPTDYLSTADIFNIFEGSHSDFQTYPSGQTWYQSYPSSRFSNIIYDVPSSSLLSDINRAESLNAGNLFLSDQNLPNPYGQLPSYWDQEVSAAAAPASVPEPNSLSLLVLSCLSVIAVSVAKRRRIPNS